ncbi:hypothetical protein EJ110_NYTH56389 [Nymphaea thermarum]|nr:hypothetical protein EJ110_NYTH56389 [Nymphaea thermarum]
MVESNKVEGGNDHKGAGNPFSYGSTVKLDGHNYELWCRSFMLSVKGHRKRHIIEEDELVDKLGKYMTWEEDDNMVMSWIMNSVQPPIASTITYYTTAKEMWDKCLDALESIIQEILESGVDVPVEKARLVKVVEVEACEALCAANCSYSTLSMLIITVSGVVLDEELSTVRVATCAEPIGG